MKEGLPVLKAAMQKEKVKVNDIAAAIGVSRECASRKIHGKQPWLFEEAVRIRDCFFKGVPLEALFGAENK